MVNLANIRKKAKEKRQEPPAEPESLQQQATPEPEPPAAPPPPPPVAEPARSASPVVPEVATEAEQPEPPAPAAPETPQNKAARSKLDAFKEGAGVNRFDGDATEDAAESVDSSIRELLTFGLAGEHYAIDIESIVEITPPRSATRIPNSDASVVGIISLRGTIVTVLDLRHILGHPSQTDPGPDARIIVLEHGGQTSGVLVDRVFRVAKIDRGQLATAPVVSTTEMSANIEGVFHHNDVLTIVLNLERLLKG